MKTFSKKLLTLWLLIPVGMMFLSVTYLIGCSELNFGTFSLPEEGFVPVIAGILIFSTLVVLIASTRMMGTKWRSAFLVAVGVTVVTYVIFIFWLNIPFPQPFFM